MKKTFISGLLILASFLILPQRAHSQAWPDLESWGNTSLSLENLDDLEPAYTRLIINIPARELKIYYKQELVDIFPIAVGSTEFKTPPGVRYVEQIVWNPWWYPPDSDWAKGEEPTPPGPKNPLGPVKMELGDTIRLHGTNNEKSIGYALSHGCMRMRNEDAKKVAWWIQKNFTQKNTPQYLEEYTKNTSRTYYIPLDKPVAVEIQYEPFDMADDVLRVHPDVYGEMKDRKGDLKKFIAEHGYDPSLINDDLLDLILQKSKKETIGIAMSDLEGVDVEELARLFQTN